MPIFLDNRTLLESFRAGDRESLAKIYLAYVDRVATLVRRGFVIDGGMSILGAVDRETQRDLIQEVFARAFAEPARLAYDGLRPYRPYLLRIAKNILIDAARKSGRCVEVGKCGAADVTGVGDINAIVEDDAPFGPEPPLNPEEASVKAQLGRIVREHVNGLDREAREFVSLRFEQEKPQRDVASAMGITRRRVRTLEKTILDDLRNHLKRKETKPRTREIDRR
jgi:RNA polymerase sigma-70 factor (ECF subfamily)